LQAAPLAGAWPAGSAGVHTSEVLAVVTFHSLEDRAVKTFFRTLATGCVCPSDFPECRCGQLPKAELLTKKSITASETELEANSRSKPARLRAVRKVIY
jgi:16S rRNA (cytosine1402-N4)-methyltransferase